MAAEGERSLEEKPTWAVSVFFSVLIFVSFSIEGGLHKLTQVNITLLYSNFDSCFGRIKVVFVSMVQFLKRRKRKSLNQALAKTKTGWCTFQNS